MPHPIPGRAAEEIEAKLQELGEHKLRHMLLNGELVSHLIAPTIEFLAKIDKAKEARNAAAQGQE